MKQKEYAPQLKDGELCDCGHPQGAGHPATVDGKQIMGWKWSYSLDGKRRLCHACSCKEVADCGHEIGEHSHLTTGCATLADGRQICVKCYNEMQRNEPKDRTKPFGAYLSGDGRFITTWTGGRLMDVIRETEWRMNFGYRNKGRCIKARDVHGKMWHGRGAGRGMCINLHPSKS